MHIYFTASQIPELRELPQAARRIVVSRALNILHSRSRLFYWLPVLLCIVGAVSGVLLCEATFPHLFHFGTTTPRNNDVSNSMLSLVGLGGGFVTGFIGSQLQLWKLRPLLRGVINDYISKIYAA